jgi:prevent-host-death family protein
LVEFVMEWKVADAKNKFSEVVSRALAEGPQRVTRHNREAVVVIAEREYERLTGQTPDFKAFLLDEPSLEGVDLTRDRTPMRDAGL